MFYEKEFQHICSLVGRSLLIWWRLSDMKMQVRDYHGSSPLFQPFFWQYSLRSGVWPSYSSFSSFQTMLPVSMSGMYFHLDRLDWAAWCPKITDKQINCYRKVFEETKKINGCRLLFVQQWFFKATELQL